MIQLIGVVLAFSIRKVKIKGLNDSKEISIILYITSIILVIVIVITLALGDYVNVNGGTFGLGISTASTVVDISAKFVLQGIQIGWLHFDTTIYNVL